MNFHALKRYAELSAEYDELQNLLEKTQDSASMTESQAADYREQYFQEVSELRKRISELEVTAGDSVAKEKAAREREIRTRQQ